MAQHCFLYVNTAVQLNHCVAAFRGAKAEADIFEASREANTPASVWFGGLLDNRPPPVFLTNILPAAALGAGFHYLGNRNALRQRGSNMGGDPISEHVF